MERYGSRTHRTDTTDPLQGRAAGPGPLGVLALLCLAAMPLRIAAQPGLEAAPLPSPSSGTEPGASAPRGWESVKLTDRKTPTLYALVDAWYGDIRLVPASR